MITKVTLGPRGAEAPDRLLPFGGSAAKRVTCYPGELEALCQSVLNPNRIGGDIPVSILFTFNVLAKESKKYKNHVPHF